MIEKYYFGSITIDGKTYNHDVEVLCKGEILEWRRKESHVIDAEDVRRAVEKNPDTIVIGTGAFGVAEVTEEAQKLIKENGIKLIIDKTEEATKTFNIICQDSTKGEGTKKRVIGFFHLTC